VGNIQEIRALSAELDGLDADIRKAAAESSSVLAAVPAALQASATNLIHYLALRRHDLRALQPRLAAIGLSSLGRSEDHVLSSLDAVRSALRALSQCGEGPLSPGAGIPKTEKLLAAHTQALLGPEPAYRRVRIMVTMPSEAARDYTLVHELVRGGMDCMRINCAHDEPSAWSAMIEHLRRANQALNRHCRVAMDLGGPKLRTGPLAAGASVLKIRPTRDVYGRVTAPARVRLAPAPLQPATLPPAAAARLPMPAAWLGHLEVGEMLRFLDARGARRCLKVVERSADGVWAELDKTSYVVPGTRIRRAGVRGRAASAVVDAFGASEQPILLCSGDLLVVTRGLEPGRPAIRGAESRELTPATIGCTLPEVFDDVRRGEAIWFDDGKIGGVVESIEPGRVMVRINLVRQGGAKLRSDKGINLPDSALRLSALTDTDLEHLQFVVRHADIVSLSFANSVADVDLLLQNLRRLGGEKLGVILKIETRRGFENLPGMLLASLRFGSCGVMIARGDLAVECGFERLAEVQEEILWLCEAAHVPVIWATQVLESLAKEGFPSRAEITDAAMSERAECVMLNKGPHVSQAVGVLDDILQRMQKHVTKKRSMLRELQVAGRFFDHETAETAPRTAS
jgi:pyruvate kinase